MSWQPIITQHEADAFMHLVGDFHDGCVRETHLWTEHYVADDLAMGVGVGADARMRVLLQRQFRPFSAIELLFEEVVHINWASSPDNCMSIITEATLLVREDAIYWVDSAPWIPDQPDSNTSTWISARRLCWRDASDWMGKQLRYGPPEVE